MTKPNSDKAAQEAMAMTADTVGRDILQALVQEIKLLPDVWPKLSKAKQDDVIDRLRERVATKITMAVHLIAAEGRTTVAGDLSKIALAEGAGVQAVIKFSMSAGSIHDLYDSVGKPVLVVVASPAEHLGGMDDIKGESDQRAMDLGQEYDPNGDGKGMDGVVDADVKTIGHSRLQAELDEAYGDGVMAATEGKPQSDCPIMDGDLCIEWVKGWKAWQEENAGAQGTTDATGTQKAAPIKYRHPDTGETWSGRGKRPQWVQQWLMDGKELEDLEPKDETEATA